jgi:hypothetical protein
LIDKIHNSLIDAIFVAVSDLSQPNLFGSKTKEDVIEACIKYLKYNGYRIIYPVEIVQKKVVDIDSLIYYFYAKLSKFHSEAECVYINKDRDRSIAKKFIESRIKSTGFSKLEAIKECVRIIDTIFEFEDEFNLKYNLNFSMFGQDNQGWITTKALEIMDRERLKYDDIKLDELHEKILATHDQSKLGWDNMEELISKFDEMEDNDACKKR